MLQDQYGFGLRNLEKRIFDLDLWSVKITPSMLNQHGWNSQMSTEESSAIEE